MTKTSKGVSTRIGSCRGVPCRLTQDQGRVGTPPGYVPTAGRRQYCRSPLASSRQRRFARAAPPVRVCYWLAASTYRRRSGLPGPPRNPQAQTLVDMALQTHRERVTPCHTDDPKVSLLQLAGKVAECPVATSDHHPAKTPGDKVGLGVGEQRQAGSAPPGHTEGARNGRLKAGSEQPRVGDDVGEVSGSPAGYGEEAPQQLPGRRAISPGGRPGDSRGRPGEASAAWGWR